MMQPDENADVATKQRQQGDSAEEAALLRKIDWRILPFLSWLYLLAFLDRSNISNVKNELQEHLGMDLVQYGRAVSIFYLSYVTLEIPANLILKRARPSLWIGSLVIAWGICSVCMIFVDTYQDLLLVRFFLGVAESGFFPGVIFYFGFWYTREERGMRIALFFVSSALAGAVGGVLAYFILQMELGSLDAWQWLFLFEGVPSILFGVITWFYLPDSPAQSAWLTPHERQLATLRLEHLRHKTTQLDSDIVWRTMVSPKLWCFAIIDLCTATVGYAVAFYLPAIIQSFHFDELTSNILSSPVHLFTAVAIIGVAYSSDRSGERAYHVMAGMAMACVGLGLVIVGTIYTNAGLSYFSMFLISAGQGCTLPPLLAWVGSMVRGVTRTAVATALVVGVSNLGGIVGPNIYSALAYVDEDGNEVYLNGHIAMAGVSLLGMVLTVLLKRYGKEDAPEGHEEEDDIVNVGAINYADNDDERAPLLSAHT